MVATAAVAALTGSVSPASAGPMVDLAPVTSAAQTKPCDVECPELDPPNGLRVEQTEDSSVGRATAVTLAWDAVAGATGYRVLRTGPDGTVEIVTETQSDGENAPATSAVDPAVAGGHHRWSVVALAHAPADASESSWMVASMPSTSITIPAAPTSIEWTASETAGSIDLRFSGVEGATGYNLHLWRVEGTVATAELVGHLDWINARRTVDGVVTARVTEPELAAGQRAYWTVEPTSRGDVRGDRTPSATYPTPDTRRPAKATGLQTVTVAGTSATLSWYAATDDVGIASYTLYRDADGANPVDAEVVMEGIRGTEVTIGGLTPGSTEHFYLKAVDAAGNRSWRTNFATVVVPEPASAPGDGCLGDGQATGVWHTESLCPEGTDDGVWQIIDPSGTPTVWDAVNVRGHSLASHPLGREDVQALSERFGFARLNLRWDQMQPAGPSDLDPAWADRIGTLLDLFADPDGDPATDDGVGVILDVAHLGGSGNDTGFQIPGWAWAQSATPDDRQASTSFSAWADDVDGDGIAGDTTRAYLDALAVEGLLTHPAVVAVEVVNEPHPRPGLGGATTEEAQRQLSVVYADLVDHIQTIQAGDDADTRLVVVGTYHGGTRHGGEFVESPTSPVRADGATFAHNRAAEDITATGRTDVVWTAHNYFTGVGDDDGWNDGQSPRGARGSGQWAENAQRDAGCYTDAQVSAQHMDDGWNCDGVELDRATAQQGHRNNAAGQFRYAQEAGMPFFMGEWGMARPRMQTSEYRGWLGADQLFEDKLAAYADVDGRGSAISWAVWSFDAGADGFGLYQARNGVDGGDTGKYFLESNDWIDAGSFPSDDRQGSWAGSDYRYAEPFCRTATC